MNQQGLMFLSERVQRLLTRTAPADAMGPMPGVERFMLALASEDRATVRRWLGHQVASRKREPSDYADAARADRELDRELISATSRELAEAAAGVVERARAFWSEHVREVAASGASCPFTGCW